MSDKERIKSKFGWSKADVRPVKGNTIKKAFEKVQSKKSK